MKLLTFYSDGLKMGVKTEQGVIDLSNGNGWDDEFPQSIHDVLNGGQKAVTLIYDFIHSQSTIDYLDERELQIGPCVPSPGKIICVGLNYRRHAIESNMAIPTSPILFNKFNNTIRGNKAVVDIPTDALQMDYEAELAIVIGKKAKHVKKEEALDYAFGYCAANDLSARDLQFRTNQWLLGKSCDGFCPVGPYLVTSDEVGNPNSLTISCSLNNEVRQNSNTSDMIFHCDEIISYVSDYMTLEPGDIILTGTPEGVIMGFPEDKRVWLKDGDHITVEIEKLGSITTTMKQEHR
jgi:2-keto-4-pentenoate hydratase/2-oxohepta-3-ene-1,7-dioic acid hydratase in catechol pathway